MVHRLWGIFLSMITLACFTQLASAKESFAILAVSWQPAFCEQRSDRPECSSQTATRYDASHFSLHGLWPGSRRTAYCGVNAKGIEIDKSGRWGKLPDLRLEASLKSRLDQIMPGTRSFLHRHEWIKHGTCHENGSTNGYFRDSLRLMRALNASDVQELFSKNIGKKLSATDIQAAFDQSFGNGAGERIKIRCKRDGKRLLIHEITIGMYGEFDEEHTFADLILAAKPTKPGCSSGIIDPVGLQ